MAASRRSFASAAAMILAGLALWVSFGAITFANTEGRGTRIGLLPPLFWLAGILAVTVAIWWAARPSAHATAPLWLSLLLLLPWLPFRMPASVFLWTGPLRWWVWCVIAIGLAAGPASRWVSRHPHPRLVQPPGAPLLAGVLAFAAYLYGAWAVAPRLPAGDEPHYLVITQSLLEDHDLQIENNHQRGDYRAYFGGVLKPDYLRRGKNLQIYSIHAPGLPFLIAPVFALFGYTGVKVALLVMTAAATSLAWTIAWLVTRDVAASWFGWAAVALSAPVFFHSFAVYPDGLCAALLLVAVLPLVATRWREPERLVVIGIALAILPWLHTRFALISAVASAVIVGRVLNGPGKLARVVALFSCPLVSAIGWFSFYQSIYGTPNPAAPYGGATQTALANLTRGVPGLLFDEQFGLLPNAPVYACAFAGFVVMWWRGTRDKRRLALDLLLVSIAYSFTVAEFQMWWAGYSAAARFLVPVTLVLAVPAAAWFHLVRSRATRLTGIAALVLSALLTFTPAIVDRGAVLFNFRDGLWQLGLWLSRVVNLTTALPSLFQGTSANAETNAAVWLAAAVFTLVVGWGVERLRVRTPTLGVVIALVAATSAMTAASIVWRLNDVKPATPSSGGIDLLNDYDSDVKQIALSYQPLRRLDSAGVPSALTLAMAEPGRIPPGDALIFLSHIPAGVYAVDGTTNASSSGEGVIRVATARLTPPLAEWPIASLAGSWRRVIALPVGLEALRIDADRLARSNLNRLELRPIDIPATRRRPLKDAEATTGARYGPAAIFIVSGRAYLEPGGLWIGGAQRAQLILSVESTRSKESPAPAGPIRLFVRNTATENQITLVAGAWQQALTLRPREERIVEMPAGENRLGTPLEVRVARGARPVDYEPGNKDERLLGCWIEIR